MSRLKVRMYIYIYIIIIGYYVSIEVMTFFVVAFSSFIAKRID